MNGTWRPIVAVGAMVLAFAWWLAADFPRGEKAYLSLPLAQRAVETSTVQQ